MSIVTVFGLQRSGTNFFQRLLADNINGIQIMSHWAKDLGIWKHAYNMETNDPEEKIMGLRGDRNKANQIGDKIKAFYIHKHPYSWIQSIIRKHIDLKKTYPFVIEPTEDTSMIIDDFNLYKLAELHRDHTGYWLNKVDENRAFQVRYEELIESPEKTREIVFKASRIFKTRLKEEDIRIPDKVSLSDAFTEEKRNQYKTYKIETLSFEQIQKINQVLNREYLSKQGYTLIESLEEYKKHRYQDQVNS